MLEHPPAFLTVQFIVSAVTAVVMVHVVLITVAYSIYLERKISAYIQDRIGPNRVGFDFGLPALKFLRGAWGLGQPLADGIKFLLKEDYQPRGADRFLFTLAPAAIVIPALIGFAIIPWGGLWNLGDLHVGDWVIPGGKVIVAGAPVNAGVVYLLAVAALGVYGVVLGGWASNNKYSFLGGLRASAQMISYEIPLGLSLLAVLLVVGSLLPQRIIGYQLEHGWLLFHHPLTAFIFFTAALAEANRAPFDNAEAEQELVGGYHTEYSSMRFALFFLAEYSHLVTSSTFFVLLFLGGWDLIPFVNLLPVEATGLTGAAVVLLKTLIYFTKVVLLVCFAMVIRWTLPRMRFDQVMHAAWQSVIPLTLLLVVGTAVLVHLGYRGLAPMLLLNVALAGLVLMLLPMLPKATTNRRVRLAGSRFYAPPPGMDEVGIDEPPLDAEGEHGPGPTGANGRRAPRSALATAR
ncbi:MAG TPA: complex I subunit 1 family protein [Phycisphaerales bacterium]|nr:complex I subunit 1 family protein [Phycisphaerales bacterium]